MRRKDIAVHLAKSCWHLLLQSSSVMRKLLSIDSIHHLLRRSSIPYSLHQRDIVCNSIACCIMVGKLVLHFCLLEILFKRAKQLRTSASWLKYKIQRNKLVSNLCGAKKEYMKKLCNLSSNTKKFWSAMKKLNNSSSSIPTLLHNNFTASSDKEKASMLNQFFSNCFNRSEPPQILTRCEYILTYALLSFSVLRKRYWNCCKPWILIRHQDQMV